MMMHEEVYAHAKARFDLMRRWRMLCCVGWMQSLFGATMLIVPSVATLIFLVAGSLQQDYIALAAIHLYTLLPGCLAVAIGFITHRINQRNFSDAYHKFKMWLVILNILNLIFGLASFFMNMFWLFLNLLREMEQSNKDKLEWTAYVLGGVLILNFICAIVGLIMICCLAAGITVQSSAVFPV